METSKSGVSRYRRKVSVGVLCTFGTAWAGVPLARASSTPAAPSDLDVAWFRKQLMDGTVEPRLRHGLAADGFYRPNLDRQWQPVGKQIATLITQTRIIYVLAAAYQVAGTERYRAAITSCANFLLSRFSSKTSPGRWVRAVAPDGKVIDETYHAYAHTHVIFALTHAYQATQDKRYLDAALATWLHMNIPGVLAGKEKSLRFNGLNFTMHCFESLLALFKATSSPMIRADLMALGQHIYSNFQEPKHGFLYEDLDQRSKPARDGEIRLGHNAEMAFLMARAVDRGLPQAWNDFAQRAINFVVAHGVAPDGSVPHELDFDLRVKDPTVVWWSHTEYLRAVGYFAWRRGRSDLKSSFAKTLAYVKASFIDPVHGGWYWNANRPDMPKGGDWNAGYHVAMMLTEMLRLGNTRFMAGSEILL